MKPFFDIKILHTTDVHGCFFPFDFIERKPCSGSMARVSSYVKRLRKKYGRRLLLVDGGDVLQGQPACYYSNYVDPSLPNVAAEVLNYMRYDVQTIGNHDIETGRAVYDKYVGEIHCEVLAANVVDTATLQSRFKPYAIREVHGTRIAFIGMLTPTIPYWLHETLWQGMTFLDIVATTRKWVAHVRQTEQADVVVGLFHSGFEGGIAGNTGNENAALETARSVAGIDLILCGHDHRLRKATVSAGEKHVDVVNPSSNAHYLSESTLHMARDAHGRSRLTSIDTQLVCIDNEPVDADFMRRFAPTITQVRRYADREIGSLARTLRTRDCFFGPAPFNSLIHDIQLDYTKADISLNAPLKFDVCIPKGPVRVSDLFNLYTYENQLYVLRMTGREIRLLLELSYDQWIATMRSPRDHIMLMQQTPNGQWHWRNLAFNFDTAAGIDYEVNVARPHGSRINILRLSSGRPFSDEAHYRVAMNSYRGNGGGELLTRGAGIPLAEIPSRIESISPEDQRTIIMAYIERLHTIPATTHHNWRFVPESLVLPALARDRRLLFPPS